MFVYSMTVLSRGEAGGIAARDQICMGASIGVVEIHLGVKQTIYSVGSGALQWPPEARGCSCFVRHCEVI